MPTTQTKTNTKTVGGKSNKKPTTTTTTTKTGGVKTVSASQTTGGKRSASYSRTRNNIYNPNGNWYNLPTYNTSGNCMEITRTAHDCVSGAYKGKTAGKGKQRQYCGDVNYVSCVNFRTKRAVSGFGTVCNKKCKPNGGINHPLRPNAPAATNTPLSAPSGHIHNRPEKVANGNRKTRKPMNRRK